MPVPPPSSSRFARSRAGDAHCRSRFRHAREMADLRSCSPVENRTPHWCNRAFHLPEIERASLPGRLDFAPKTATRKDRALRRDNSPGRGAEAQSISSNSKISAPQRLCAISSAGLRLTIPQIATRTAPSTAWWPVRARWSPGRSGRQALGHPRSASRAPPGAWRPAWRPERRAPA